MKSPLIVCLWTIPPNSMDFELFAAVLFGDRDGWPQSRHFVRLPNNIHAWQPLTPSAEMLRFRIHTRES